MYVLLTQHVVSYLNAACGQNPPTQTGRLFLTRKRLVSGDLDQKLVYQANQNVFSACDEVKHAKVGKDKLL